MTSTETNTVPFGTLDELDLEAFDTYLREHVPRLAADHVTHEDALLRLKLAGAMGTKLCPTVAGLYVFGREPQFAMPQLGLVAAKFAGRQLSDEVLLRVDMEGPLLQLRDSALRFVRAHARELVNQIDPAASAPEFPMTAVSEAISNALVHRDLRSPGRVAVRIFDGRIEIWSPGSPSGLPEPVENYLGRGGVSLPRNPLVAVLARQLGMMEQLGRGLAVMERVVREEAHGEVGIQSTKDGVLVTIPSAIEIAQKVGSRAVAN